MSVRAIHGDCLRALRLMNRFDSIQFDSVVTDPPYHLQSIVKRFSRSTADDVYRNAELRKTFNQGGSPYARQAKGFMGKQWDGGDIAFDPETWRLVYRVMRPGAHLVAFGGTRGFHRMFCAIEDAGFEIRDCLSWNYGSGFPKSHSCAKAIQDLSLQAFREDVLRWMNSGGGSPDRCSDHCRLCDAQLRSAPEVDRVCAPSLRGAPTHSRPCVTCTSGLVGNEPKYTAFASSVFSRLSKLDSRGRKDADAEQLLRVVASCLCLPCFEKSVLAAYPDANSLDDIFANKTDALSVLSAVAMSEMALRTLRIWSESYEHYIETYSRFEGWGTALKPAWEPICLARKPLIGTVAANVQEYGTGALNIDGCRIGVGEGGSRNGEATAGKRYTEIGSTNFAATPGPRGGDAKGRWPANLCHDGSAEVVGAFPITDGQQRAVGPEHGVKDSVHVYGDYGPRDTFEPRGDFGSAPRFFYAPKAGPDDRHGSKHPTVKPVSLMRWLVRLITPPGGTVLDPFAGSGTTGIACIREGFDAMLIEREAEYIADINRRIAALDGSDTPLFSGAQMDIEEIV